jgi:hypothetical protein
MWPCGFAETASMATLRAVAVMLLSVAVGGCGSGSGKSGTATPRTAEGARRTLLAFEYDIQNGKYAKACAMYTPAVRAVVQRQFGGCIRNLSGLHALAEKERAHGSPDPISTTIQRARIGSFLVSHNTATTTDLGRPGTVTSLVYSDGHWEIDRPAT